MVQIVQLRLRVVNWISFILRELGVRDQTQPLGHVCLASGFLSPAITSGKCLSNMLKEDTGSSGRKLRELSLSLLIRRDKRRKGETDKCSGSLRPQR